MVFVVLFVTVLCHGRGDGYRKQQNSSKSDGNGLLHRSPFDSNTQPASLPEYLIHQIQ
jgi:hypothetical protein